MRTLLVFAILIAGCHEYKYNPSPLNAAGHESGKKQCNSPSDCASGSCGSDGRCR